MKTFNASDLAHKRTEIFNAAKAHGAILQKKNTNGVVLEEFIIITAKEYIERMEDVGIDVSDDFSTDEIEEELEKLLRDHPLNSVFV
jgi:archaellum biogenesis ATPase FlaH